VHGVVPACVTTNGNPAIVSVATRADVPAFAAAEKLTVPFPVPLVPALIVNHVAELLAVHAHPDPTVTPTDPLVAAAPIDLFAADSAGVHVGVKEKRFDSALMPIPPGPTAATRDSYCTPPASGVERRATKSTRMNPSVPGAGFPRATDRTICVLPTVKICSVYDVTRGVPSAARAL
jgi:hypothetical protein